jgi:thymidylate synthase
MVQGSRLLGATAPRRRYLRPAIVPLLESPTTLDAAYRAAILAVLDDGALVEVGDSLSTASGRRTLEVLNYSFTLADCRNRIITSATRPFNLFVAVGRWAWFLAGSSLLREIEFYDPHAARFSDDGVVVPGSCDGARLIAAGHGVNQIQRVVDLLRKDANTRRAAVTIYAADDVGRESADVPCTMGLIFNLRDGVLHTTVLMRANNALTVLPYDVFQFSMFAEFVAAQLGARTGPYHHFAASMHAYDDDRDRARAVSSESVQGNLTMPPMPDTSPAVEAARFVAFEARLRGSAQYGPPTQLMSMDEMIDGQFADYWADLARVLLIGSLRRSPLAEDASRIAVDRVLAKMGGAYVLLAEHCAIS